MLKQNAETDSYVPAQGDFEGSETEIKNNNSKKWIIGTGAIVTALGLGFLAKKGKLGDGAKEFMEKIFGKASSEVGDEAQNALPASGNVHPDAQADVTRVTKSESKMTDVANQHYDDIKSNLDGTMQVKVNDKKSPELEAMAKHYEDEITIKKAAEEASKKAAEELKGFKNSLEGKEWKELLELQDQNLSKEQRNILEMKMFTSHYIDDNDLVHGYYFPEVGETRFDFKITHEMVDKLNTRRKEAVEAWNSLKNKFSGLSDDEIKAVYSEASAGKSTMDITEYRVLKEVVAEKFEPANYKFPKKVTGSPHPIHHDLNRYNFDLHNGTISNSRKLEIDAGFEALKPLEEPCTVYRGRVKNPIIKSSNKDFGIIENAKVGDTIIPDTGCSYTGFSRSLADNWCCNNGSSDAIMYEIRVPKGAKVSRNLEHGGEMVFPRESQYKMISKGKDPQGVTNVVLEYILPKSV
ncbi:MAG: hypothetical protein R3Y28_02415 [Candidatus Gastranaerophilales bacterium]